MSRPSVGPSVEEVRESLTRLSIASQPSASGPTEGEPEREPNFGTPRSTPATESSQSESEEEVASTPRAADPPDTRWYAVWRIPRASSGTFVGIHTSVGNLAYCRILGANQNDFPSIRFKRADTKEEAQRLFREEAAVHDVDPNLADTIFRWS